MQKHMQIFPDFTGLMLLKGNLKRLTNILPMSAISLAEMFCKELNLWRLKDSSEFGVRC